MIIMTRSKVEEQTKKKRIKQELYVAVHDRWVISYEQSKYIMDQTMAINDGYGLCTMCK